MSTNPYEPTKSPLMDPPRLSLRWSKALAVWWSVSWRGGLYGILGGLLLGAIGGMLAAVSGVPEKAQAYGTIAGYITAIPASMLGMKQGLSRHLASLVSEYGGLSSNPSR